MTSTLDPKKNLLQKKLKLSKSGWQSISKIQADCTTAMKVKLCQNSKKIISESYLLGVGLSPIKCLINVLSNNTNASAV